jgi:hypothetical protein
MNQAREGVSGMSSHNNRLNSGTGKGKRVVKVLVAPETEMLSRVGVGIGFEGEPLTAIAPDEARTIALRIQRDDPALARALRDTAAAVDQVLAHPERPEGLLPVRPIITGPAALRDWTRRHREAFRDAYRAAPSGGVVWATPTTESLDDPPRAEATDVLSREAATEALARLNLDGTADPPQPGMFYVIASRESGRFQGTFVGMLPVPGPQGN